MFLNFDPLSLPEELSSRKFKHVFHRREFGVGAWPDVTGESCFAITGKQESQSGKTPKHDEIFASSTAVSTQRH